MVVIESEVFAEGKDNRCGDEGGDCCLKWCFCRRRLLCVSGRHNRPSSGGGGGQSIPPGSAMSLSLSTGQVNNQ